MDRRLNTQSDWAEEESFEGMNHGPFELTAIVVGIRRFTEGFQRRNATGPGFQIPAQRGVPVRQRRPNVVEAGTILRLVFFFGPKRVVAPLPVTL